MLNFSDTHLYSYLRKLSLLEILYNTVNVDVLWLCGICCTSIYPRESIPHLCSPSAFFFSLKVFFFFPLFTDPVGGSKDRGCHNLKRPLKQTMFILFPGEEHSVDTPLMRLCRLKYAVHFIWVLVQNWKCIEINMTFVQKVAIMLPPCKSILLPVISKFRDLQKKS